MSSQSAVDQAVEELRLHPMFDRCVRIYRHALIDWDHSAMIREAAETLGVDRRAYCDQRLQANQFQWFSPGTRDDLFTKAHLELAWIDAGGLE